MKIFQRIVERIDGNCMACAESFIIWRYRRYARRQGWSERQITAIVSRVLGTSLPTIVRHECTALRAENDRIDRRIREADALEVLTRKANAIHE